MHLKEFALQDVCTVRLKIYFNRTWKLLAETLTSSRNGLQRNDLFNAHEWVLHINPIPPSKKQQRKVLSFAFFKMS